MNQELQIIDGLRAKRISDQKRFYLLHGPVLMGICMRYMVQREMAEEVFHDGMLKIFNKVNKFQNKGSFIGWCKRLMVNTCLDQLRKQKDHLRVLHIEDNPVEIQDEQLDVDDIMEEKIEILLKAILGLPTQQRLVLNLFILEKYSHREVAEQLSITESASRSLLLRAKKGLKQILSENRKFQSLRTNEE